MKSIEDVADWIIKHRSGRAFINASKDRIVQQLVQCSEMNTVYLYQTVDDDIIGIVCARPYCKNKVMFVDDILVTQKGIIKQMLKRFIEQWPGYTLEGIKKCNKKRKFTDMNKLLNKLS